MLAARFSVLLCFVVANSAVNAAEPPTVERFVPAGAQRGSTTTCRVMGKAGDGEPKVISQSPALQFSFSEKRDTVTVTVAPDTPVGVHWLRVANAAGASEVFPFVVGVIPELAETEPNARLAEANVLTGSSMTVNGVLEKANDVDTFAIELAAGQTVVASQLASRILASPMDGVLQIVDGRGTVLAQNDDDSSMDPLVTYTAPADGRYYVRTFAFPSAPNSTIGFAGGPNFLYRLTITTEGFVDHTTPLARQAGVPEVRMALHGWNLPVTEASLAGGQKVLNGQFALPWFVHDVSVPVQEELLLSPERRLTVSSAVSAELTGSEEDEYRVGLEANQRVILTAEVQRFGSLLDPVLLVKDATGKVLKEQDDVNNDTPDARLEFAAPAAGDYQIVVRDRFEGSGERRFYLLLIEQPQADFRATVKSTSLRIAKDKPAEIPVAIERQQGFAEPLTFRIDGLPDGVTAELPRSEKDGDSSKAVTLKLTHAQPVAWSGSVRIVATSADSSRSHAVTWKAPDGSDLEELWLTIVAE
ncbi:MAG: PPC domain-containing protein [Planctomycetaceae bacterium]